MVRFLVQFSLLVAAAYIVVTSAWLREHAQDTLPDAAASVGVAVPLSDPRIVASVSRGCVELFDGGVLVKRYPAGFGRHRVPGLVGAQHASTPVGDYVVTRSAVREQPLLRGARWIEIDFPSEDDAARAFDQGLIDLDTFDRIVRARRRGEAPPCPPSLGGPFGIQGNFFTVSPKHCTDGSIALSNADVIELWRHVPVGTPVTIIP